MKSRKWLAIGKRIDTDMDEAVGVAFTEKDAQLIAAAPDMLEALKTLLKTQHAPEFHPHWNAARAAIAKAEGR